MMESSLLFYVVHSTVGERREVMDPGSAQFGGLNRREIICVDRQTPSLPSRTGRTIPRIGINASEGWRAKDKAYKASFVPPMELSFVRYEKVDTCGLGTAETRSAASDGGNSPWNGCTYEHLGWPEPRLQSTTNINTA